MHQPLDPRIVNVCLDSNSLQPPDPADLPCVGRFIDLWDEMTITVVVPEGARTEALHPNVPSWVRERMAAAIYTIQTSLTEGEVRLLNTIEQVLNGNAQQGKHAADASHVFNAVKYGGYFITHDERILKRAKEAHLPPSIQFTTMAQFIQTYDEFAERRP